MATPSPIYLQARDLEARFMARLEAPTSHPEVSSWVRLLEHQPRMRRLRVAMTKRVRREPAS